MAIMSNCPGPSDPATIWANVLALLDCVDDRTCTSSSRGRTDDNVGLLSTSPADNVGLLSTPAGILVLEDQFGTYALRVTALETQLQDRMACWAADHLAQLTSDVNRDGNILRQQVHSDCYSTIAGLTTANKTSIDALQVNFFLQDDRSN